MTLTKIVNSKPLAMLMGAWIAYCVGVGDYGGAVFLLFFYSLMLWDLHTKKATGAGTPMAKSNNWIRNLQGDYNICQKKILQQKLKNLLTM